MAKKVAATRSAARAIGEKTTIETSILTRRNAWPVWLWILGGIAILAVLGGVVFAERPADGKGKQRVKLTKSKLR
eukprot:CAMPEP_0117524524 /NCGR_PEP_ID=MMETSP0784-20121206/35290_1 /TAXON_ID=39447 /ORGANISM="" /LENGTH=74 /DNA_ID=CAMNT_0005320675 /DNA_START=60 /DNA_END=284 /DNA_ORIENTATION=-